MWSRLNATVCVRIRVENVNNKLSIVKYEIVFLLEINVLFSKYKA